MREILFRSRRVDNGEWVEGYFGVFNGKPQMFVPFTEEEEKQNEGHIFSAVGGLWHKVILETVGQFTGLLDKNGKKIFEGDIIKADNGSCVSFSTVKYGNFRPDMFYQMCSCTIGFAPHEDLFGLFLGNSSEQMFIAVSKNMEVIGNIHDNAECLNDTDKT